MFVNKLFSISRVCMAQGGHTGKVGPRPWGGTKDPGSWSGTLGWDPGVGP